MPTDLLHTPLEEDLLDFENLLSLNDPMEMPSKTINPINQPKLNTNFKIPKVKNSNCIQKRKASVRPFKILPSSSTRKNLESETVIVHQSANSLELESKIAIQVKKEQNLSPRKPPNFDTSLNYALSPFINRFKIDTYHPYQNGNGAYRLVNAQLPHQHICVPAAFITAQMQTPILDSYTDQVQKNYINDLNRINQKHKTITVLREKNKDLSNKYLSLKTQVEGNY